MKTHNNKNVNNLKSFEQQNSNKLFRNSFCSFFLPFRKIFRFITQQREQAKVISVNETVRCRKIPNKRQIARKHREAFEKAFHHKMDQMKCGVVFRDGDGNFNYTCLCCEFEFMSAIDFEEHVNAHLPQLLEIIPESEPMPYIYPTSIKTEDFSKFTIAVANEPDEPPEPGETDEPDIDDEMDDVNNEIDGGDDDGAFEGFEFPEPDEIDLAATVNDILDEYGEDRQTFPCDCCDANYDCMGLKQQHLHKYVDLTKSCGECPAYYEKEFELNAHKKLHNLANTMMCPFCFEIFTSVTKMKRHLNYTSSSSNSSTRKPSPKKRKLNELSVRNTMTVEKGGKRDKYVCDICSKEYAYLHYLKEHLKRHSENTLLHTCQVCGHEFKLRQNLTAHMRTHTGEKVN